MCVALIVLIVFSCGNKTVKPLPAVVDSWVEISGTYSNLPMEIRLNKGLAPIVANPHLSYQIGISVPLHDPLDNGLPDSSEREQLKILEKQVVSAFAEKNETYFAIVVITNSTAEFIFYTNSEKIIREKFKKTQQQITGYQLKLNTLKDPHWGVYKQFSKSF